MSTRLVTRMETHSSSAPVISLNSTAIFYSSPHNAFNFRSDKVAEETNEELESIYARIKELETSIVTLGERLTYL